MTKVAMGAIDKNERTPSSLLCFARGMIKKSDERSRVSAQMSGAFAPPLPAITDKDAKTNKTNAKIDEHCMGRDWGAETISISPAFTVNIDERHHTAANAKSPFITRGISDGLKYPTPLS